MSMNERRFVATLVRGELYGLPKQSFRPGEKHVISEEIMVHLDTNAIQVRNVYDPNTGEAFGEPVAMFDFQPFTGPKPAGHRFPSPEELEVAEIAKAARARSRRVAMARVEPTAPAPARARTRSRTAA